MRVLMFGWEFPPYNSGGLGIACLGLSTALANTDLKINFILPKKVDLDSGLVEFDFADIAPTPADKIHENIDTTVVNSALTPYMTSASYINALQQYKDKYKHSDVYGSTLMDEVLRYGALAEKIALNKEFDVIHAHDWLSFLAGITAKRVSGKPFVAHIHATEMDRTGGHVDKRIFDIERMGMEAADKVVAVSQLTKNTVVDHYGIDPNKVEVVHNGIDLAEYRHTGDKLASISKLKEMGYKIVLFVGRLTLQKGPEYLIKAAARVVQKEEKVKFVVAGSGDMETKLINLVAELGIADKVIFPGFVRGNNLRSLYSQADAFVMPSVSEPFGLVALEAVANDTPVIVSKQSGAAEVMNHAIKVDFWDEQAMADGILGVLKYGVMYKPMTENSFAEASKVTWDKAAGAIKDIYQSLVG